MPCIAHRAAKAGSWENRAHVDATSPVSLSLLAYVRTTIFAHVDLLHRHVAAERAVLLCDDKGLIGLGGFSLWLYEGTGQQLCGRLVRGMPTVDVHCVRRRRLFSRKRDADREWFRGCLVWHGGWRNVVTFRRGRCCQRLLNPSLSLGTWSANTKGFLAGGVSC